jgi:hypothetical protein
LFVLFLALPLSFFTGNRGNETVENFWKPWKRNRGKLLETVENFWKTFETFWE